jgi:Kef-type K+ transport system membrane component KefB
MILGMFFSNTCSKAETPATILRELSAPIFTLFFVLIGARLNVYLIPAIGIVGVLYLLLSITGKTIGATLGAIVSSAEDKVKRNIGFALYSQAGISLGLGTHLYFDLKNLGTIGIDIGNKIMNILIPATLILLIIGPIMVKYTLERSGEIYKGEKKELIFY